MKLNCIFVTLFLGAFSLLSAENNLCQNSGFESKTNDWRYGSAFGGSPGFVKITDKEAASGKQSLHFHKDGPKGGAQIFCVLKTPAWENVEKATAQIALLHKGKAMTVYIHFRNPGDRKPMKNEFGKALTVSFRIPTAAKWTEFKKEFQIPQPTLKRSPAFELQFQMWGQGDAYLDDVSFQVKTVGGKPVAERKVAPSSLDWLVFHEADSGSTLPPVGKLPYKYGEKDGVLTKNGKAHFYTGNSTVGGGQYNPETIWLARLLNYSMVTLDWGIAVAPKKVGDKLEVSYPDPAPSVSMFREMTRNGLVVEHDTGNAAWKYNPLQRRYLNDFPQMRDFITSTSHFYSYDHNTEIGRKFHFNGWKNRYRYLKGVPIMATEIYNELGYTPTHERVCEGFRTFAKKKYGTLANACRVWHKQFKSWDEVLPPHLSKDIMPGTGSHGYRKQMVRKYWQMHYDWIRFLQLDLIPGLAEMKKQFRTVADTPFMIDWRGHRSSDSDGYAAVDPDLLDPVIDINGLHTGVVLMDYRGNAADEVSVIRSLTHNAMHFDFVNSNNGKVTINPECIVSRTATPGNSLDSMRENSFKNFSSEWKFRLDKDTSGLKKGYYKTDFDDSKWDVMKVPGCWDETAKYRDKKGYGWYRTTFTVPGRLRADYEDGSRRFCVYGKGVAQKGTIWINGIKVGEPKGWNAVYKYDVSPYLKYGKENQITYMVDGSNYANGLRFYVFVLPEDRINRSRLLEKRDYASFLWTHMMHGASGVVIWHWDSPWRPFMAEVNRELERVSAIAMPAARNRKAQVAMLMPFLYFRGLPTHLAKYYRDYMTYYAGLMFNQVHATILTEKNILKVTPERYPLVLYPFARIVQPETFSHFKSYVENGGTAVVTLDSLRMDFNRYKATGLESFIGVKLLGDCAGTPEVLYGGHKFATVKGDMCKKSGVRIQTKQKVLASYADGSPAVVETKRGKGRVIFVAANLNLAGTHALLGNILKQCNIHKSVEIADVSDKTEFPYIEAQTAGNKERFLIYLHNWGGKPHKVTVRLPFKGDYTVRNVRFPNEKAEAASGTFCGTVAPTQPGAWLFERKGVSALPLKNVSADRSAVLKSLADFRKNPKKSDPAAPKVLFIEEKAYAPVGRLAYPNLTSIFRAAGAETWGEDSSLLTPERMKQFRCIVLMEANSTVIKHLRSTKSPFIKNLLDYVKNGGNLFICASSMRTAANTHQSIWWRLGPAFGISAGAYLRDDNSCGYGDPYQIRITEFGKHPVTKGVKSVQMFVTREFRIKPKCTLKPILLNHGRPVMIGGSYGKGNVILATDVLWMQPTRAEKEDNARLLTNIADFMLNRPVGNRNANEIAGNLVLTEQQLRKMETEEE